MAVDAVCLLDASEQRLVLGELGAACLDAALGDEQGHVLRGGLLVLGLGLGQGGYLGIADEAGSGAIESGDGDAFRTRLGSEGIEECRKRSVA